MGNLAAAALAGVIAVDGFLAQRRRQLFQRTGSVSYTHLDVYKRQAVVCAA